MIKIIKNNKTLSLLIFITVLSILIGIFLPALLEKEIKEEITNNIFSLIESIKQNQPIDKAYIYKTFSNNTLSLTLIWTLGISIIGIPIIILYYILKTITYSLEITFLIINIKNIPIIYIPFYSIPCILNAILYFLLTYYAISFSIILIKILFFKKEYNLKNIMRKYIKLFFIILIGILISSIIEILLIPTIIKFFI